MQIQNRMQMTQGQQMRKKFLSHFGNPVLKVFFFLLSSFLTFICYFPHVLGTILWAADKDRGQDGATIYFIF